MTPANTIAEPIVAARKHKSKATGKTTWSYCFDASGSSRQRRKQIAEYGFASKKAAQDAEAQRRVEAQREYEAALRTSHAAEPTLAALLDQFYREYARRNLAPKTIERRRVRIPNELIEDIATRVGVRTRGGDLQIVVMTSRVAK